MGRQCGGDLGDDLVERAAVNVDREAGGLAIERLADGQQCFDLGASAAGRQVGTPFARRRVGGDLPLDRLDASP